MHDLNGDYNVHVCEDSKWQVIGAKIINESDGSWISTEKRWSKIFIRIFQFRLTSVSSC